jgi:hypothetical protein
MPGPFTVGETITLEVNLTDPDTGAAVDAGDVVWRVKPPTGSATANAAATNFAPGVYRGRYLIADEGEHWFEFSSVTLGMQKEGAFVAEVNHVV